MKIDEIYVSRKCNSFFGLHKRPAMSSEPPFPAPKGMEWDPAKKRFFKVDPKRARVAPKPAVVEVEEAGGSSIGGGEQGEEQVPIKPAAFPHNPNDAPATFVPVDIAALRSGGVSFSASSRYRSANIASRMAEMSYRETVEIDFDTPPNVWARTFALNTLDSVPELGALMWMTTRRGSCLFFDSSERRGSGMTRVGVRFGPQHWRDPSSPLSPVLATRARRDENEEEIDEEQLNFFRIARIIDQARIGPYDARFTSFAHHRGLVGSVLVGEKLWFSHMEPNREADQPRGFDAHGLHVSDVRVTEPCGFALRRIEGGQGAAKAIVAAYGLGGRVGYVKIVNGATDEASVPFRQSDIFDIDILPSGKQAWMLCRNGNLYSIQIDETAADEDDKSLKRKRKKRKLQAPAKVPTAEEDRVVAFRIISDDEVLILCDSGNLYLSSPNEPGLRTMQFSLPHSQRQQSQNGLAVDVEHRLFALGGPLLVIWSLDRPVPLYTGLPHGHRPFGPLTFCPRFHVACAEKQGGSLFLPRGLPGLATGGMGSRIEFYE